MSLCIPNPEADMTQTLSVKKISKQNKFFKNYRNYFSFIVVVLNKDKEY
jgi:hypothetical protein